VKIALTFRAKAKHPAGTSRKQEGGRNAGLMSYVVLEKKKKTRHHRKKGRSGRLRKRQDVSH